MKKIKLLIISVIFFMLLQNTYGYDQVFPSVKLRFGKSYIFTDTFNSEGYLSYIRGATTRFSPESVKPTFSYSAEISNRTPSNYSWYVEANGPDSSLKILESSNFVINYLPAEGRQSNNIEIVYNVSYQNKVGGVWSGVKSHTEYQPYEITWCGDGIVDNYTDPAWGLVSESCDDGNNINGDGCSSTCETEVVAHCTGLTVDNTSGIYSCTGNAQATSYRLFSNGIEVSTNNTGVFNISNIGSYTFECLVNGESRPADPECSKDITITNATFDLALRKTITSNGPYNVGDIVDYNIAVINQGGIDGTNIEVTDYIPDNMELVAGNGWSTMGVDRKITQIIPSVPFNATNNATVNLTLRLRILSTAQNGDTIVNYAEISSDNGDDCDSTPDNINGNTTGEQAGNIIDDDIGNACNPGGDEDDHDLATIVIGNVVACQAGVTGVQTSPISSSTPNLCSNVGESVINFVSTISGNTTNYLWNCTDGTTTYTGGNCNASYTSGGGGGGGGGSTYRCNDIAITGTEVKCVGNSKVRSIGLLCSDQDITELTNIKPATYDIHTGLREATFTNNCDTGETPICYVINRGTNTYSNLAWKTSPSCKEIVPTCGNGKIDAGEECEVPVDDNGNITGPLPPFCSSTCQIENFSTIPVSDGNLSTEPNQGEIGFVGIYDKIIGDKDDLGFFNNSLYIWNNSDYTFGNSVFNGLCLTTNNVDGQKNTGDSLSNVGLTRNCTPITTKFYPGQKIYLKNDLSNIIADKNKVDGLDYEDNKLVLTIKTTKNTSPYSQILNWSDHLTGKFTIRVAKPAIRTTGGTSYNNAGSNTKKIASNINTSTDYSNKSDNDVGVGTKSSASQTTTDTEVVKDATTYSDDSSVIDNSSVTSTFEKYNGLDNVFIKSGDTNISDIDYTSITEPTTYIIDGGNLVIDRNITPNYNHNIAFVLKNGGNIVIKENVTEIKGTYIVLDNGEIKSDGNDTDNVLIVKGSLYGDTTDLVNHRIKVSESNGELSFGTIVSFGSSIFQKPAPMVTSFINDYLSSEKVAK